MSCRGGGKALQRAKPVAPISAKPGFEGDDEAKKTFLKVSALVYLLRKITMTFEKLNLERSALAAKGFVVLD
jgi:hypothetical protein